MEGRATTPHYTITTRTRAVGPEPTQDPQNPPGLPRGQGEVQLTALPSTSGDLRLPR